MKIKLLGIIAIAFLFLGCTGVAPKGNQSKGLSMDLSDAKPSANLNVGVIEFVVK